MKFSHIDPKLSVGQVKIAAGRFERMMVELGIRESNYHVGTGLGGNNFQLVTLMNLEHHLVDSLVPIKAKAGKVFWSVRFLVDAKYVDIRHELDKRFPDILEKNKYMTMILQIIADYPEALRQGFEKYQAHFPKLVSALSAKVFQFDPGMSNWEKLIAAFVLCQDLAKSLDKGETDKIKPVGLALIQFPPEIILLSVRRYIQIDRLVSHNLDEHPEFAPVLLKVTRIVN